MHGFISVTQVFCSVLLLTFHDSWNPSWDKRSNTCLSLVLKSPSVWKPGEHEEFLRDTEGGGEAGDGGGSSISSHQSPYASTNSPQIPMKLLCCCFLANFLFSLVTWSTMLQVFWSMFNVVFQFCSRILFVALIMHNGGGGREWLHMTDKIVALPTYILPKPQRTTSKRKGKIKKTVTGVLCDQLALAIKGKANLASIIDLNGSGSAQHSVSVIEWLFELKELIKTLMWSHSLELVKEMPCNSENFPSFIKMLDNSSFISFKFGFYISCSFWMPLPGKTVTKTKMVSTRGELTSVLHSSYISF